MFVYKFSFVDFTEMMRFLGYPRLISLSNFRVPNFPLVAEILVWLEKRFDPDADIPTDHNTEDDRVAIIRRAAEFMVKIAYIIPFIYNFLLEKKAVNKTITFCMSHGKIVITYFRFLGNKNEYQT